MNRISIWGLIAVTAVYLSACAAHNKAALGKNGAAGQTPAAGSPTDTQEASLRARVYDSDPQLKPVHFALDKADFDDKALAIMKDNVAFLKTKANDAILVEGYADDRGTLEYNLALGQRRAEAIKEYYHSLSIPISHMSTISYGKLKPICTQDDEECWGQNRRGETKIGTPVE